MKLRGLKFRGIGRFHGEVDVPIQELNGAELVSVRGGNGEGKTTALESFPGALYRSTPSRGAIQGLANARDSYVEVQVETDQVYTARLAINGTAKTPTTEAYLTDGAGQPLANGKARDYDAAVAKLFPSQEVLLASAFAAQGGEGRFLDLPVARRRELFAQLLGLGKLQELSRLAAENAKVCEASLASLRGQEAILAREAAEVGALQAEVAATADEVSRLAGEREAAEALELEAKEAEAAWVDQSRALDLEVVHAEATAHQAKQRHLGVAEELARQRARLRKLEDQVAGAHERLAAQGGLQFEAEQAPSPEELSQLEAEVLRLRAVVEEHHAAARDWQASHRIAEQALERAEHAHQRERDRVGAELRQARKDIEQATRAAAGLQRVPCKGLGEYGGCPLIATAARAQSEVGELQARVVALEVAVKAQASPPPAVTTIREALDSLGSPPDAPTVALGPAEELLAQARQAGALAAQARAGLAALQEVGRQLAGWEVEADTLRSEIAVGDQVTLEAGVEADAAAGAAEAARIARHAHQAVRPKWTATQQVAELARQERNAVAKLAVAEQRLVAAEQYAHELVAVRHDLGVSLADLDDWRALQSDLGPRGIQALEIDAASPEVSHLTNELLHACYGPRFSVELATVQLKADGKGTKEVIDLRVLDAERGTEGSADQLSGGEKVLVSEALSLAIATYNARRAARPMLDLFRDECSGALSADNAGRYIEMLRRAVRLGGFHRCYFVAHQPALWALADAQLVFEDGKVRVEP